MPHVTLKFEGPSFLHPLRFIYTGTKPGAQLTLKSEGGGGEGGGEEMGGGGQGHADDICEIE